MEVALKTENIKTSGVDLKNPSVFSRSSKISTFMGKTKNHFSTDALYS